MAMDSAREQSHNQEVNSQTLESMLASTKTKPQQEKKPRPAENSLKCPRCDSGNTKFCYYNNYSLSQPRYFCKSCRRYWTKGGTLRNVPVGGGCRKTKRSSSNSRRINHDHAITAVNPSSYAAPASYDSDLAMHGGFQKPPPGHLGSDGPGLMSGADCGLIDALRGGFLEIPRGFHNLCGGHGNGNDSGGSFGMECGTGFGMGMGMGMGIGIGVLNQEMGLMGFEEFGSGGAAAVKQETGNIGERWGLNPWQNVGAGEGNMGDLDSTRIGSWNGIGSSSWHGLLNSPLM